VFQSTLEIEAVLQILHTIFEFWLCLSEFKSLNAKVHKAFSFIHSILVLIKNQHCHDLHFKKSFLNGSEGYF
jgi:hypothetical protein